MNSQTSIERCGCGSLLLSAQEVRSAACEPCQAKAAQATRAKGAVQPSTAVVNVCRHDYLVWACLECKEEQEA